MLSLPITKVFRGVLELLILSVLSLAYLLLIKHIIILLIIYINQSDIKNIYGKLEIHFHPPPSAGPPFIKHPPIPTNNCLFLLLLLF